MGRHDQTLGMMLWAARRHAGVTSDEASAATHIPKRAIEAFENDDYGAMPPRGYAQNMLGAYARYLGISPRRALDLYRYGLGAAVQGRVPEGTGDYRRGRPIDVSSAAWADPENAPRASAAPRRKIDSAAQAPCSPGAAPGETPAARVARAEAAPAGGGSIHDAPGEDGRRRYIPLHDARRQERNGGLRLAGDRRRSSDGRRFSSETGRHTLGAQRGVYDSRQGGSDVRRISETPKHGTGRGAVGSAQPAQCPATAASQEAFGKGYGLAREKNEQRLEHGRRPKDVRDRARRLAPLFLIFALFVIAIVLIVSANAPDSPPDTITLTPVSQASTDETVSADDSTTQTGNTNLATGPISTSNFTVTVEEGSTSSVTVKVDGQTAYLGMMVGQQTLLFTAATSFLATFDRTGGVSVTCDGVGLDVSSGEVFVDLTTGL